MFTSFRISTFRWIIASGLMLAVLASALPSHQTTVRIEAQVRVDNQPASSAIQILEQYLYNTQKNSHQQLQNSITDLTRFSYLVDSSAILLLLLLEILFFGFTNHQLIAPLSRRLTSLFSPFSPQINRSDGATSLRYM